MGTQNSTVSGDQCIFLHSKICLKSIKKLARKKKKAKNDRTIEQFIIDLHRKQVKAGIDLNIASDSRRLVFVSLLGLYQTWRLCPAAALYSAIFVLPLKREWIYDSVHFEDEMRRSLLGELNVFQDDVDSFLRLLRWKDDQNLAFWMIDHESDKTETCDTRIENDLIRPFWRDFSQSLANLYDPVTGRNYKPLKFNQKWWQFSYKSLVSSRFNVAPHKILSELFFLTKNFKAIQEILYQSNPDSFHPIISYNSYISKASPKSTGFVAMRNKEMDHCGFVAFSNGCCPDIDIMNDDNDNNEGIWMISAEYDENDLSEGKLSV